MYTVSFQLTSGFINGSRCKLALSRRLILWEVVDDNILEGGFENLSKINEKYLHTYV